MPSDSPAIDVENPCRACVSCAATSRGGWVEERWGAGARTADAYFPRAALQTHCNFDPDIDDNPDELLTLKFGWLIQRLVGSVFNWFNCTLPVESLTIRRTAVSYTKYCT